MECVILLQWIAFILKENKINVSMQKRSSSPDSDINVNANLKSIPREYICDSFVKKKKIDV